MKTFIVLLCFFIVSASCHKLTLQVEPKTRECFYQEASKGQNINMDFEVIRGGLLDIKLSIMDPNNNVITEKLAFFNKPDPHLNAQEGKIELTAHAPGIYSFCFDNTMSRWTAKVVTVRVPDVAEKSEPIKYEHLTKTVDSVMHLGDTLHSIDELQHYMRIREQSHRDAIERSNSFVQWLSIIESVMLLGMSFVQLSIIQKWFYESDRRGVP